MVAEIFDELALTVLGVFDSLRVDVQYYRLTSAGTYDPVTDAMSAAPTPLTIRGMRSSERNREIEPTYSATATYSSGELDISVEEFIFAKLELLDASGAQFEPQVDDYFVDPDGIRWEIARVIPVPGKAIFKVQVRS